jgi:hypothetical protein
MVAFLPESDLTFPPQQTNPFTATAWSSSPPVLPRTERSRYSLKLDMAVLPEQNAEVVVMVEGQPAPEYENDDDTELDTDIAVTRYVEAVSGKTFAFMSRLRPGFRWQNADSIVARPVIDGKRRTGIVMPKRDFSETVGFRGLNEGEWSGSGSNAQLFKFTFANLETSTMNPQSLSTRG